MFKSQLFWRLYAGYVVLIIISTLIVGMLMSQQMEESSTKEIHHSLAMGSQLLAEVAKPTLQHVSQTLSESPYQASLQARIVYLGNTTESRLTAIDRNGKVVADSQEDPHKMDNHNLRPEIVTAREVGSAIVSRYSKTLQQQMVYRALSVMDGDRLLGFVRVSLPLTSIDKKLNQLKLNALFGMGIAAGAALILGLFFANRFLSPLVRMTEVADSISKGDYDRRIKINQNDELGLLAKAVNRMALSSSQRMEEITQDRNRLAKILTGMVEGVIYVDEDLHILHINQAAAKMLSLSMTDCLNMHIWERVRIQEITSAIEQALETSDVVRTRYSKVGESIVLSDVHMVMDIYAAPMFNEDGRSNGAVVVLNDISELAHLERIRRDFVANASHELKTPITAIRALTETILDDHEMPENMRQRFTEKINAQSLRLSALVSDLMTISRLEADEHEQQLQIINFKKLVERSLLAAKASCQEKNINLSSNICDEWVKVEADQQALSQLVDNLLNNAVKYTPNDGSITLSLMLNDAHESDEGKLFVALKISDTGIGISPQFQTRIFERFYRVDKARSRDLGGTGLGLSIVKNIAEQHGGSVSVKSRLGEGTSFLVLLPMSNESNEPNDGVTI